MRTRTFALITPLIAALAYGCGDDGSTADDNDGNTGGTTGSPGDADGDNISDNDEGADEELDTDGDGTPDYLDTDSDGDGIDDSVEAGDTDLNTPPSDADGDGVPNFQDTDSDDNGILDGVEGVADIDNDGVGDFADSDNDGDSAADVAEIAGAGMDCNSDFVADPEGTPDAPADCDGDGTPNFNDKDSDNDNISDSSEGTGDTDTDGFLDRYELDSDNDTFGDLVEAGDDDLQTAPVDTDGDNIPDFQDPDSDNDGVPDLDEAANGTNPKSGDSDNDGVSDLIEIAAGTDPNNPADNPQANGDFVFVVPYQEATTPPEDTLEFRTSVQFADIYFLFDETGSMSAEFAAMNNQMTGVPAIISELQCQDFGTACAIDQDCATDQICFNNSCVEDPLVANMGAGCIPDMWTGVGRFNNCNTYQNTQHVQPDPTITAAAVGGTGPGSAEAVVQSPACVADPSLCTNNPGCSSDPSVTNPVGCAGYRPDAVRILISITDADNQGGTCGGTVPTVAASGAALQSQDIKFISLYGTGDDGSGSLCTTPQQCAQQIGTASGTVDTMGNPFAYPALDAAVVDATKQAVLEVVRGVPLDVTIDATDEPGDAGDSLQFLDYLEVNISGQGNCTNVNPTADTNADTYDDSFPALLGGTPVCWDVHPVLSQSTVPPTKDPQLFQARLTVSGDGSPLDSRTVYFLVPPAAADIPDTPK